jgi:ABC-type Mn2+/Zn2+ transport system ATPase subunit
VSVPVERRLRSECVHLDAVTVRFGRLHVLRQVTVTVHEGEYVCVRGANGAGKTTLLRVVAGAIRPASGARRGPARCAYVPPALAPPALTVRAWLRGVRHDRVDDPWSALDILSFDGDPDGSCRELSYGNLRKVLLADALTSASPVLAVDEAHAGLDHSGRTGLERLVTAARTRGAAVLVAAQDDDAVEGTDRTLLVGGGDVSDVAAGDRGVDGTVVHTLRGPRSAEAALLEAAERHGFRAVDRDDR